MLRKAAFLLGFALAASAWGQSVISAHSGVIQYTEGQVTLDGQTVVMKTSEFPDVKTGQTLAAEDGRAEILLTPGVFLRIAENSSFKMVSNKLSDTRIEMLSGSALFEVGELLQDNAITVQFNGAQIALAKKGLYRIDSDPGRLRVYDGEAKLTSASGQSLIANKGREVALGEQLEAKNFDTKQTDEFYRWSERRDEYVAEANVSAAKYARDSGLGFNGTSAYGPLGLGGYGYGYGGLGYGAGMGTWAYNPWFGMFTYMPYDGMFYSPFGFGYFSPGLVGSLYMPGSPYFYGAGYTPITTGAVSRNGSSLLTTGRTPGIAGSNPGGIYRAGSGSTGLSSAARSSIGGSSGLGTSSGMRGGGGHAGGGHH
ncbi:MAG TPA: FecR domain-containing protein [Bryobacteraceae bacterium]|nr:FecR domain-containing protein [Bryobacteraceae bacterium]